MEREKWCARTICTTMGILYYKISREKFEPEPGFEPRTSGLLARRSTTWAILVLMPAHVQIFILRRVPLLPGGVVMTLSAILLTTSEITSPFTWIWYSNQYINWKQTHNFCLGKFTLLDLIQLIIRSSQLVLVFETLENLCHCSRARGRTKTILKRTKLQEAKTWRSQGVC